MKRKGFPSSILFSPRVPPGFRPRIGSRVSLVASRIRLRILPMHLACALALALFYAGVIFTPA